MAEFTNDKNVKIPLSFTYKNDTYGKLTELYDRIKNYDLPENSRKLFFEIHFITNEAIDYAKSTELKTEKYNNLERMLKVINEAKHNIDCVSIKDIADLEDGFNFDLGNRAIKFIEGADEIEKKLRKAIEPKKKNNAGARPAQCMEAPKLINLDNESSKIIMINILKENYSRLSFEEFNRLIAVLEFKNLFIKTKNRTIQLTFEKLLKPIGDDKKTTQTESNFNARLIENYNSYNVWKYAKGKYGKREGEKKGKEMNKLFTDLSSKMSKELMP